MSDRERWIVYPIVFLALVLGLNNYIRRGTNVAFGVLECNSLIVRSPDGKEKIRISGIGQSGQLAVYGADNSAILTVSAADGGKSGQLIVRGETGANIVLTASQNGSNAKISTDNLTPQIVLGYSAIDDQFGLTGYEKNMSCVAVTNDFGTVFYTRDGVRRALQRTIDEQTEQTSHDGQTGEPSSRSPAATDTHSTDRDSSDTDSSDHSPDTDSGDRDSGESKSHNGTTILDADKALNPAELGQE